MNAKGANVRLEPELLQRAEAQWDTLMEHPQFRDVFKIARPRRSGIAAVRLLLELKLSELEAMPPAKPRKKP